MGNLITYRTTVNPLEIIGVVFELTFIAQVSINYIYNLNMLLEAVFESLKSCL